MTLKSQIVEIPALWVTGDLRSYSWLSRHDLYRTCPRGKNVREVNLLLKDSTGTIFVILIIFVGLPQRKTFYAQSAFVTKNTYPINNVITIGI